jgi:hypothetical protein
METCPIKKNFMKIPRFGREGYPYWRGILLFQCKFLNAEAGQSVWPRHRLWAHESRRFYHACYGSRQSAEVANRLAIEFNRVASRPPVTPPQASGDGMPWTDLPYLSLFDSGRIPSRKVGILHVDGVRTFPITSITYPKQTLFGEIKAKNHDI